MSHWPDDGFNAKKPRYSAETSSKLLVNKNLDLENTRNELVKVSEHLDAVTRERDETTIKLRDETSRLTAVEELLRQRTEELNQERLSRANLETELDVTSAKCKELDKERKGIEQQFNDFVARQDAGDQRSKIASLERKIRSLQTENAALSAAPARPSSRTSSIPLPSSRRPRSSSENRSPRLEEDLKTCRAELVEVKDKLKKAEIKIRQTEDTTIRLENEKTALDRKAKAIKAESDNLLQEAKEEIDLLQLQIQASSHQSGSATEYNELSKAYTGSQEQLQTAIADKQDLEKRLARKIAQCETLQEKLDGCMYPSSDDEILRQELAEAKEEASRAKRQLIALKREMESLADRRDSLLRTRYELQDRDLEVQSLEEKLRRRESAGVALVAQEEQAMRFFNEREAAKDKLQQVETRSRYFESQLQFRQQELNQAQSQIKDLEHTLAKSRAFTAQQREIYNESVKSCTIAEERVANVERELMELRDELANRSTTEEAAERNRQWALALERVNELERALDDDRASTPTPRAPAVSLPPVATFSDQADMDAVASLFVTLQRIREERDTLRGSVEFLSFELRAKENAVEHRLESQRSSSLQLLRSAEEDVAQLRGELTACEARLLQSHEESRRALEKCTRQLSRTQVMAAASFVALQRADANEEANANLQIALEEEREASHEKLQGLRDDLKTRDGTIVDLNDRCSEATRHLREATRDLRSMQEKFSDLEDAKSKLETALEEETAHYRDLERDNSSQAIAYQRLEETHNILREELYEARMEADQLRNNHMDTLADQSPDAQSALQGHIEELDARIMRRNEQIGAQQNDIRRLDMNLKIAEAAVDEMRMELGELRAQNISLEEDAATVRQERNLAERELENARGELDALRVSSESQELLLQQSEEGRELEVATLVEVISNHGLQIRQVSKYLEDAHDEIQDLQCRLAQRSDFDKSQSASESQVEELEQLKQTLSGLSAQQVEESRLADQHENIIQGLERALQEARERGDALAIQLRHSDQLARDEVSVRINALEEQVDSLSAEVETLEERLAEGQQHVQIVLKQNGDLENQVGDMESAASTTSREHMAKVEGLESRIKTCQDELDGLRVEHETERDGLLQELERLKQDHSAALEITKQLDEAKTRVQMLQADAQVLSTQLARVSSDLQARTAENTDLLQRVDAAEELRATVQSQEARLQAAQTARVQAELDLASVRANLRKTMEEKNAALEQYRYNLSQADIQIETIPHLRLRVATLEAAASKMKEELHEAQQAASAAASTTVRDADVNMRLVQLETVLSTVREENEELERVLALKTREIEDHDDRHIELLKERKKLVAKTDSLSRKLRNMQKQLDAATGVAHIEAAPSSDLELGNSAASSVQASTPIGRAAPRSLYTPEILQVRSKSSFDIGPTSASLPPTMSNGPRRSDPSLALAAMERASSTPKPLSSSTPPVPMTVATPSSALNLMPASTSHTPLSRVETGPPAPTSSSRKRRLPDDFDPSPEEQLPAMPVLSTTPARLRKALREGPMVKTGFTPSRSRKSSAAAPDKELATAAAAAVASLNLAGTFKPDPFSASSFVSRPQPTQPPRATFAELDLGLPRAKPPSDITNTGKINRPSSSSSLYAGGVVKADSIAPVAPRARGGWLSGARNGTGAVPRGAGASEALARAAARRTARALPSSPKLGSGIMPRRPYGDIKVSSRELS